MDKRIIAFLAASVFAASAGAAGMGSDKGASAGGDKFSTLDVNGDGKISKDEAQGDLKDNWSAADANQDGNVDQAEFSAFEGEQSGGGAGDPGAAGSAPGSDPGAPPTGQ